MSEALRRCKARERRLRASLAAAEVYVRQLGCEGSTNIDPYVLVRDIQEALEAKGEPPEARHARVVAALREHVMTGELGFDAMAQAVCAAVDDERAEEA
jgi:hypothetical protein